MIFSAQAGDRGAMQWLYQQYAQRVFNLALRLLCHRADAQDAMQDAFVKCFASLHQYRGDAPFWYWLRRVVTSTVWMRMRSAKRRGYEVEVDEAGADDGLISPVQATHGTAQAELEAALRQLPDVARTVVWLYHVEGYTHPEIAEIMSKSVSFSKSRLARAHKQLRELLGSSPQFGPQTEPEIGKSTAEATRGRAGVTGKTVFEASQ